MRSEFHLFLAINKDGSYEYWPRLQYIAVMASSRVVFFVFLLTLASFSSSSHCRKISSLHGQNTNENVYVQTLLKEAAVATPVHATIIDEKLIASQVEKLSRRRDQSAPSPSIGHGH
ncbi:hypothetical protein POM88_019198 [Heracleum sosnowskyi]|uniref:Uncharacterized protein n=1 Tax=Heracleum sosnowskyi TaxID=360622 RepID=A0AAD8MVE6_9APIA|nr:hypothetical protein POM88_019198 [Heracleum sosnowskyi]